MDRDTRLGILASAILEGTPVDWGSAEATAEASDRPLLRQLQIVGEIAALHRRSGPVPATHSSQGSAVVAPGPDVSWGDLQLLERIGRGTFGDVYRAWDPHLDRDVALKLLRARATAGDPSASISDPARVVNEGRLLARVRHPNVITVYGAEPRDGAVGIWMEFIRGRTLHDMVEGQGPFGAREAAGIGTDLCRALAAVHGAGLLHRDVTARNVMREDGGRLVLMDFGVGHELRDNAPSRGMDVTGTPLYMAPELFIGRRADQRTDIYSLGVLLYFIVTGRFPVAGRTLAEIGEAHARGVRTQLRDSRPDLPAPLVRAIETALTADPDGRFQTIGEFDAALDEGIQARHTTRPLASGWGWKLAVGTIGVAAMAGVAWVTLSPTRRGDNSHGAPPQLAATTSVTMRRLSSLPAVWGLSNPSDDGRFAAGSTLESSDAAIVDLATGEFRALGVDRLDSSGEGGYASRTVLSPDGTTIAVNWWTKERGALRIVRVDGSGLRTLVDSGRDAHPYQWSRDGSMILAAVADASGTYTIALVAAVDGAIRPLRRLAGWVNDLPHQASLSPDGRYVAYDYPESETATDRDIFILDSHTGDHWPLGSSPGHDMAPVWSPEGEELVFFSDRNRTLSAWAVTMGNGHAQDAPRLVKDDVGRVRVRGFTRSGNLHIDLTVGFPDVFVSRLDSPPAAAQAISPRLSWGNFYPAWSPDGRALAYTSERHDKLPRELWVLDLTSGRESRVVTHARLGRPIGWSPDGMKILASGENNGSLYVVDRAGHAEMVAGGVARARWLPEGVAFEGPQKVVLYDEAAGRPLRTFDFRDSQISSFGLAHDGRSALAVLKGGRHVLHDIRGGASREWRDPGVERIAFHAMAPQTASVAYVANRKELANEVKTLTVWGGSGEPRELLRMRAADGVQFVGWTNDGQNVLVIRWSPPTSGTSGPTFRTLWKVPISGAPPAATALTMEGLRDVSLHPDGRQIAFNAGWKKYESWVIENLLAK